MAGVVRRSDVRRGEVNTGGDSAGPHAPVV
jgi:hypothetical protein